MADSLGDRMKHNYEDRYRVMLPRRTFTVIRVDGKAFHTYTRHCTKPIDRAVESCMNITACRLCEQVQGAALAYVQSDEISIIVGDFATIHTEAWFDGNLQKMVSVSASMATEAFNSAARWENLSPRAHFDARVFVIPDAIEVENYLIWRQQDATRNSIQGLGQAHFSHTQMHGLSCPEIQEKLFTEHGINWNDQPVADKRGRCIVRLNGIWETDSEPPVFTADRAYIASRLPRRQD